MIEIHVNKVRSLPPVPLEGQARITLGRSSSNQVVLTHPQVSREHCAIEVDGGRATLRDLGSRHGTRLNGRPVSEPVVLGARDVIGIGPFEITLVGPAAPAPPAPSELAAAPPRIEPIDVEAAARLEILEEQIRTMRRELKAALTRGEIEARAAAEARAALAERERSLELAQGEIAVLRAARQGAAGEAAAAQRRAEAAERDLEARSRRLEEATALGASLRERLERLEAAREAEVHALEELQSRVATTEVAAQQLHETAQRLSLVQRGVRALEALWLETSEWVEESQESDPGVLEHALQQRDSVSEKLEGAHAERDLVVAELQALIERLRQAAAVQPGSAPEAMPARTSWLARRRAARSA
jgi:hypothetical protein